MRVNLASLHFQKGDIAVSAEMFREAIAQFRQVGNPSGVATAESDLAASLLPQGKLLQARQLMEQSIPDYQAVEDKEGVALTLNNLGDVERQSGNLILVRPNVCSPQLSSRHAKTDIVAVWISHSKLT